MSVKNLMLQPLPATARQIKAALSTRLWTKPGYRIHNVRPTSPDILDLMKTQFYAGATPVTICDHPGVEMYFFSDDSVARVYFYCGQDSYSATSTYLWGQLAKMAAGVVDIGAYTGLYSLLAARVAPRAQVMAFEPLPHIGERLLDNASLNSLTNITLHALAVRNFNGSIELPLGVPVVQTQLADLGIPDEPPAPPDQIVAPMRSLDALDRDGKLPRKINLISIDTGGEEYSVLDGGRERIARDRPVIFCDLTGDDAVIRIAAFAANLRYKMHYIHEEARGLSALLSADGLDLPPDLAQGRGAGKVVLSPDPHIAQQLVSMAERFAQKPRILRPAH